MRNVILLLAVLLASRVSYSQSYNVGDSKVSWQVVGTPGFLRIDGEGGHVMGKAEIGKDGKASGVFTVTLADFTTGVDLRDKHMREKFLEISKFPVAKLELLPWSPTVASSEFTGNLTIKGVTKPVKGEASLRDGHLIADLVVSIPDYPIGVPSYLGITVAKDVKVAVEAEVKSP